jgi:hypothetical protein
VNGERLARQSQRCERQIDEIGQNLPWSIAGHLGQRRERRMFPQCGSEASWASSLRWATTTGKAPGQCLPQGACLGAIQHPVATAVDRGCADHRDQPADHAVEQRRVEHADLPCGCPTACHHGRVNVPKASKFLLK